MPACGFCGAEFGKVTDAEAHGLGGHGHLNEEEADVVYYEGDFPDEALRAAGRR